jgi:predicted AAA+ superfamily ATPase
LDQLKEKEFAILAGARQTGKTTLLGQLADLMKQKHEDVYSLTLEDPAILTRLNQHPENLFEFVIQPHDRRLYVLLDEVQHLANPSNFLKLLYDKYHPGLKIVATGSSAFYMDRKFSDSLAGRKRLFELYTLDFDEFLLFRTGSNELQTELERIRSRTSYVSSKRKELEVLFLEYLTYGGYPAVALASTPAKKTEALKELTGSFLKRDIVESKIQDQEKFYRLMLILAQQTGSLVNMNELSRTLKLSVTAIENYLYSAQKCFHIRLLRPFYGNIRKELTKMSKVYFNDLGFRNAFLNSFHPLVQRTDRGMVIENYAFIRLRTLHDPDSIRFWRTAEGNEIDFILTRRPGIGEAVEIKFDETQFNQAKYRKFMQTYPGYTLHYRAMVTAGNTNSLLAW